MTVDYTIKAGDRVPDLAATLTDAAGTPVNLTGNTGVAFRMTSVDSLTGTPAVDAAAVVDTPATGSVHYAWGVGDTDDPGLYYGEFQVTWGDGRTTTFPNGSNILIKIVAQLA
jgi:hypothetical protein